MDSAARVELPEPGMDAHDPFAIKAGTRLSVHQARGVEASRIARERKRPPHPATSDKEYTEEEMEVLTAIRTFQVSHDRKFPTHTEIFGVLRGMGYVRVPHGFKIVPCHDARVEPDRPSPQPHVRIYMPEE